VRLGPGEAKRLLKPNQIIEIEPGQLGYFLGGIELAPGGEHPLNRKQHEAVLGDCAAEFVEGDPGLGEVAKQRQAILARLPADPVEQTLGFEVDLSHGAILSRP
jgi:hypothetical protein